MKRSKRLGGHLLLSVILLLMVGCETINSRIQKRTNVFNSWDVLTQERIRRGEIKEGDDFDRVYIALGSPDENQTIPVANGPPLTTWTYSELRQRTLTEETVGYTDHSDYDIKTGTRVHYKVPDRQKVSRMTKERGMMVIFKAGVVSSVQWGTRRPPPADPSAP